jgi:hypothetical protein
MILEPGRHILFGEWCRAQHSVFYSRLPDYFLAFDIWDRYELYHYLPFMNGIASNVNARSL